MLHLDVSLIT